MVRFGRFPTMFALGIALVALGFVQVPEAGAQPPPGWRPLALVGYNADVIADKDATVLFSVAFDGDKSSPPANGSCSWFEAGIIDAAGTRHDNGLPAGTTFESATGSGAVYLIQPAVLNNILQVGASQSGTLTLLNPASYSKIAIISASGSASATSTGTVTINYADLSSDTGPYNTFDWCNNAKHPEGALTSLAGSSGTGRNCPPGNLTQPQSQTSFQYDTACGDFNLYETVMATNNTKNILSLTFTAPDDANWSGIFGISAIP
jgi:hypothetical protein